MYTAYSIQKRKGDRQRGTSTDGSCLGPKEAPMGPGEGRRTGFGKWEAQGVSRREFLRTCAIAAAAVGLPGWRKSVV